VCQFNRLSGGFPVIALDLSEKRLEVASKLGATVALRREKGDDIPQKISKSTKWRRADVVFEVMGNPEAIPWELNLVRSQGRLVVIGSPRGRTTIFFHDSVNWPGKLIIGAHTSSHPSCETSYNPRTRRRNTECFSILFQLVWLMRKN
jgi:threonine dehydrogenase-like Zn-dependent dehydrogenase